MWDRMVRMVEARSLRMAGVATVALGALALAGCGSSPTKSGSRVDSKYGVSASPRVVQPGQPVPKGGGTYRVGKPYVVAGRTYVPAENTRLRQEGIASWYGSDFHGRLTANGEVYDMHGISAAHPTMPIPSYARVTNLRSGRSIIVRVNDRGPFHADRVIDLSQRAADLLEFRGRGLARVRVEYAGRASLDGSDDRRLLATLSDGGAAPLPSHVRVSAPRPFAAPRLASGAPVRRPAIPDVPYPQARAPNPQAALIPAGNAASARGLY